VVLGDHPDPSRAWPDAVSVSAVAARHHHPVVLTAPDRLPASSRSALQRLRPAEVVVVGGSASVADAVLDQIRAALPDATVHRVAGPSRYDTSKAVDDLDEAWRGAPTARLVVADGRDWPDALAAGPAAARAGAALLLVDGDGGVPAAAARMDLVDALVARNWRMDVRLAGGTVALSPQREADIRARLACL
jgi:hypothetical protein